MARRFHVALTTSGIALSLAFSPFNQQDAAMLYAHSLSDQPASLWQSLECHLRASAQLAETFASAFGAGGWAALATRLHDLGKASREFQAYISGQGGRRHIDHSTAGARLLLERWQSGNDLDHAFAHWLAYCIAGHHGGLPDLGDGASDTHSLRFRLDPGYAIPDYSAALDLENAADIPPPGTLTLPFRFSKARAAFGASFFVRMLFSCLTDADFLDTEHFYAPESREQRGGWPPLEILCQRLHAFLSAKGFLRAMPADSPIVAARKEILKHCRDAALLPPGAFTLTVPTGGGKTLSSLAFALEHARRHQLDRIILVAPYTSIIEQNAQVLREALGEDAVLEHHSNYIHPAEQAAADRTTAGDACEGRAVLPFRLAAENWHAPVIVTTAVQFFESLFSSRPSRCRKLHNIARSVVILDEAQMLPVPLLEPSVLALRELTEHYGVSLVLCTATQPALRQDGPLKSGFAKDQLRELIPAERITALFEAFTTHRRLTVSQPGKLSDEELGRRLQKERQVLCIVNSRAQARAAYESLGHDDDAHFHLSARMTPRHRLLALEAIRRRLERNLPCRVVSTTLIECGVDISFPCVYRAECGLDSVAQAAGRCNRSGELPSGDLHVYTPQRPLSSKQADIYLRSRFFSQVAQKHADIFAPAAVEAYFKELYGFKDLDTQRLLATLREKNPAIPYHFHFRSMDDLYQFIPKGMVPVIVTHGVKDGGDLAEKSAELVRRLEKEYPPSRLTLRLLQGFSVQVYPHELMTLRAAGNLETLHNCFDVLRNGAGYDQKLGLLADDPTRQNPEDCLF